MILWVCTCGFETRDGHEAFLHRQGDNHFIKPLNIGAREQITGVLELVKGARG